MSEARPIFLIQPPLRHAGFAACVLNVLNYVRYCEREGYTPVVLVDASCETRFLDPAHGDNVWEQYFEPVGPLSSADVRAMIAADGDGVRRPEILRGDASLAQRIRDHEESIFTWMFGRWRQDPPDDLRAWFSEQRRKGRETVSRYVRVRPHILEKVDRFFAENLVRGHTLGVHLRGTDLHYAPPVSPAECFGPIERYLGEHPDGRVFLATDQVQYVEVMRKRYGDLVRYRDCLRSTDAKAPFNRPEGSPYQKGEDVLIDILLLSRCDFLIRGASNIPEMAIYFARDLPTLDLSLEKRFAFGQDYLGRWSSLAARPAWDLIKRTDLERVSESAGSQTRAQRLAYEWRRAWAAMVRLRRRLRRGLRGLLRRQNS